MEILAVDMNVALVFLNFNREDALFAFRNRVGLSAELLGAEHVSGGGKRRVKLLRNREAHGEIAGQSLRVIDHEFAATVSGNIELGFGKRAFVNFPAVLTNRIADFDVFA